MFISLLVPDYLRYGKSIQILTKLSMADILRIDFKLKKFKKKCYLPRRQSPEKQLYKIKKNRLCHDLLTITTTQPLDVVTCRLEGIFI